MNYYPLNELAGSKSSLIIVYLLIAYSFRFLFDLIMMRVSVETFFFLIFNFFLIFLIKFFF